MKTIDIAKQIEEMMINSLTKGLKTKMTLTDLGMQIDPETKEQFYLSNMKITIDTYKRTPVSECMNKENPVKIREISDFESLKEVAKLLLGIIGE